MNPRLRSLVVPSVFTLLMGAFLIWLGVWQLHRLAWKDAIISRIEARTKAPPQPLPSPVDWSGLKPDDYEYRHVALDGTFRNDKETLVFRSSADGSGYLVMTPLDLKSGGTVIVDRGFVPDTQKDPAKRANPPPGGEVHLTGLMREPEPRNLFTPADEPDRGQFFTRDPKLIAAHAGVTDAAPFTIDADASSGAQGWPHGGATEVAIPNNHFAYAMTWFGLALTLFGVFGSFAWRRLTSDEDAPHQGPSAAVSHR